MSDFTQLTECLSLDHNFDRNFGEFVKWINTRRDQGDITIFDLAMIAAGARKLFFLNTEDSLPGLGDGQLEEEWQECLCLSQQDGFLGQVEHDENGYVWPTDLTDY